MKEITLLPLVGAEIRGIGRILFGQSKDELMKIFGDPNRKNTNFNAPDSEKFFYYGSELSISFTHNKLDFIECNAPYCKKAKPIIFGKEPFSSLAEDLVSLLAEKNNGATDKENNGEFSYRFIEISVGIYREMTPQDMIESIEEAKQDGCYEDIKEWLEADLEKSKHFHSIGIGTEDYYRK